MSDRSPRPHTDQPDSFDPIPYLRGRNHLIEQQRLDYILSKTTKCRRRQRRLVASSVVGLVVAMSLFADHSIPMATVPPRRTTHRTTHNDPARPGYGVTNRLLTDLLDPLEDPANQLVVLYHRRGEQELAFDEIKAPLNGRAPHLRSKTPRGAVQELYGLLLGHRALRPVTADAAGLVNTGSNGLSFTDALRIVQCRLHESPTQEVGSWYAGLIAAVGRHRLRARRNRWYPRVIKRPMTKWHKKGPRHLKPPQPTKLFADAVVIT
jgi:hypothetical protein